MKTIFGKTAVFIFIFSINTYGQIFRLGTGIGIGTNGGTFNILELNYAPSYKLEYGAYGGITINGKYGLTGVEGSLAGRYGFQGKYYFREEGFKPYAGLQIGLLSGGFAKASVIGTFEAKTGTKLDVAPIVGFRVSALNVNVAYQSGLKANIGLLFGFGEFQ